MKCCGNDESLLSSSPWHARGNGGSVPRAVALAPSGCELDQLSGLAVTFLLVLGIELHLFELVVELEGVDQTPQVPLADVLDGLFQDVRHPLLAVEDEVQLAQLHRLLGLGAADDPVGQPALRVRHLERVDVQRVAEGVLGPRVEGGPGLTQQVQQALLVGQLFVFLQGLDAVLAVGAADEQRREHVPVKKQGLRLLLPSGTLVGQAVQLQGRTSRHITQQIELGGVLLLHGISPGGVLSA